MPGLPGSIPGMMPPAADDLVRRMRDLERRMDEMGPSVAKSFTPVVDDLAAQVAFLTNQSVGYASSKTWFPLTNFSGTGDWQLLAYDATYDDEYVFQASSTGVLEITISAAVILNDGSVTEVGATSRGYSLTWAGGSLPWSDTRGPVVRGTNCGYITVSASNTTITTVPSNAVVTMRTLRCRLSPAAPATTWHGTSNTTVVVTRVGI